MSRIARLFFATLLAVAGLPPLRTNVSAAPHAPPRVNTPAPFSAPRAADIGCALNFIAEQLASEEVTGQPAGAASVAGRDAADSRAPGGPRSFASRPAAARDGSGADDFEPDDEACKRIAKEFIEDLKETESALAPISSSINEQMGSSGARLDAAKFASSFPSIMKRTEEDLAKRGINMPPLFGASGPGAALTPGALLGVGLTILGTINLYEILEHWDKQMEHQWATDLINCGLASNPEQAFEMAEAMGDIRMHWFMENSFAHLPIAKWYHGRETVEDGRMCLARNHQERKDRRQQNTRPGSDYHVPSRPGRPNSNHGDPRTSGSCKRYEYFKVEVLDDKGNVISTSLELRCVEYW